MVLPTSDYFVRHFPPVGCTMMHNGLGPGCSVDPMFTSMTQPQPRHDHLSHRQASESNQPQASIMQPKPLTILGISSAGMLSLQFIIL